MKEKIRDFAYGGVGVTVAYLIITFMVVLVTGTTATDTMFKGLIPMIVAAGGALLILAVAFS